MKTLSIKAVVLTDGEHYLIHGTDGETPEEMFKAVQPIWTFDPSKETAHFVELMVEIPELEKPDKVEEQYKHYNGADELIIEPDNRMDLTLNDLKPR